MDFGSPSWRGETLLQQCRAQIKLFAEVQCLLPIRAADKWENADCNATLASGEHGAATFSAGLPPAAGLSDLLSVVVLTLGGNEILRRGVPFGTSVAKLRTLLEQAAPGGGRACILRKNNMLEDDDILDFLADEKGALHAVFQLEKKNCSGHDRSSSHEELLDDNDALDKLVTTINEVIATRPHGLDARTGVEKAGLHICQQTSDFLQAMLRGRQLTLVGLGGQMRLCNCTFARRLQGLKMQVQGINRTLLFSSIVEVFEGNEPSRIPTPLDLRCATIAIDSHELLTFRMQTIDERHLFAICVRVLANLV